KEAGKAFIHIDEMISHPVLDKRYLNITEFNDRVLNSESIGEDMITPLILADQVESSGRQALELCTEIEALSTPDHNNYQIEINDIKSWSYLSLYFAAKLRAGVALDEAVRTGNRELQDQSVRYLEEAAAHWKELAGITSDQYQEVSLLHLRTFKFSWKSFYPEVLKDIEIAKTIM
ncbi:hypothetical protein ACFLSP_04275, partial [Bacteroidota bacterium]